MKKLLILVVASVISISFFAQGNSQAKGKGKDKSSASTNDDKNKGNVNNDKEAKEKSDHDKKIWDGTFAKAEDGPKPSKNQPAKVRAAFQRDYPGAGNVSWSKYRGDWTATFRNGVWMSTAVYHANGERRDTRTPINRGSIPKKIFDIITRKPEVQANDVIKIEVPKAIKDIFRIKNIIDGKPQYTFYDSDGLVVQYNY